MSHYADYMSLYNSKIEKLKEFPREATPSQIYQSNEGALKGSSFFGLNAEYVLSSSRNGSIVVWNKRTGGKIMTKTTTHKVS